MQNLIAGNWKCKPVTRKDAENIFNKVKNNVKRSKSEILICPPFVYLPLLRGLPLGGQNCFYEEMGAFTGEISAVMLKDIGAEYVIIGHSERRRIFDETDEIVNKKIKKAVDAKLKIILCIGESGEERDLGRKNEILERQIRKGLEGVKPETLNLTIAYEPIWAIGTGKNCSVEETKESIGFIRKLVNADTRIIYGGSVDSKNSGAYIKEAGANGLLVGGASLDADEFIRIVKSADLV